MKKTDIKRDENCHMQLILFAATTVRDVSGLQDGWRPTKRSSLPASSWANRATILHDASSARSAASARAVRRDERPRSFNCARPVEPTNSAVDQTRCDLSVAMTTAGVWSVRDRSCVASRRLRWLGMRSAAAAAAAAAAVAIGLPLLRVGSLTGRAAKRRVQNSN